METRQISYMLAIAETGSVTKAAEGLFIAQSALDQQLLKLERELGAWLFHSARNRLVPTEAGEIYLRYARQMLGLKEEAYRIIQDLAARAADAILPGADVVLKPDLVVAAAPESGAATHAGVLSGRIECLFDHGFRQGSVIEGSGWGTGPAGPCGPPGTITSAGVTECLFTIGRRTRHERWTRPSGQWRSAAGR